jgi:hypothetical protein
MSKRSSDKGGILYPSEKMIETLYEEIFKIDIYHFHDCAGRAMRDCRVFRAAEHFLQIIFKSVSAKVPPRVAA